MSLIVFVLSVVISLFCIMLFAAIAAPFRYNSKKARKDAKKNKICPNRKWLIFHFSCICIFIVYYLPILFYCLYSRTDEAWLKIILLLFNIVSIYLAMIIMDSRLFKPKEKSLDNNIKNYIYLLTLIAASIILVIFALLNIDTLKKNSSDADDFLEYMLAPLAALIGNIVPLKSMYSMNGVKAEVNTNKKSEYFIENKKDKHNIWLITGVINCIIALFFFLGFYFEKISAVLDNIHIVSIVLGIAVSSILVRMFRLME
ncbi:hypothetical protein [Ruminococcus flavefaciens]|uniref:hypothetical protein n=1 Tax=Ruminococcus flavefaciens TaxID=1265 RepID=UPI00048DBF40|nr:hypothetical protein [Ruminococcus flavefaciens]